MLQNERALNEANIKLARLKSRQRSLRFGGLWLLLAKCAAVCALAALLTFVYAVGAGKWWGVLPLLAALAAAAAIPLWTRATARALARVQDEAERLEKLTQKERAASAPPHAHGA